MFSLKNPFGGPSAALLRESAATVAAIGVFEPEYRAIGDDILLGKTQEFRKRLENETLDNIADIIPISFGV